MAEKVAIIGAGLAGAFCARALAEAGRRVCVFEKSGGTGGRLSTRRSAAGEFDHGAQYLTARGAAMGALIAPGDSVLDVGTGDGQIASLMARHAPGATVTGVDIMERPNSHVPVTLFDGLTLPQPDNSFDVVSFVDVLHHTDDPRILLKDHFSETAMDNATLRLMDWVGNAPHGVVLPYNYGARAAWNDWFSEAGLRIDVFSTDLSLYPFPFSAVFGRKLHFVARLSPLA